MRPQKKRGEGTLNTRCAFGATVGSTRLQNDTYIALKIYERYFMIRSRI